jgi:hypothetical protein
MHSMQPLTSWLMKYRFAILCLLVFGVMCLHTRNQQWGGDFWEHSAVVRELATHILHPMHPELLLDAPHADYSPYTFVVALLARMLHSDAITALSIMGLVNLGLLFLGLRLFVFSIAPLHRSTTAFYTLVLTLFCWGYSPWYYSGFFHLGVLGYVLPYPSTFATALTLIALGTNRLRMESKKHIWLIPIFLIAVIVLISHPITFIFLAVGIISQSCSEKSSVLSEIALIGSLLSLAFLVAIFWPYFPILKLFMGETGFYDESNRIMYQQVVSRIWPSLLGVPLVIASMRSNWRRPEVLMLVILSGIYAFGAISGKYSYGRVISYIVLLLHVTIAENLSMLEYRRRNANRFQLLTVPVIIMVLLLFLSMRPLGGTLWRALPTRPSTYESYLFLPQFTRQYDVVLSDIESSWIVPAFGGKVVATALPLAFVPDQDVRRADLNRFFNGETLHEEREQIIQKYKANYLLLRKRDGGNWHNLQQSFMPQGQVMFKSDSFVLIWLKPNPGKGVPPHQ